MARIRKHGKKWQVLYRNPATGKERSAGCFLTKGDASRRRRSVEAELSAGILIDPKSARTVYADWAERWLGTRTDLKPKTVESYRELLSSRLLPAFGETRLTHISTLEIEEWVASMVAEGVSSSRIRNAKSVLSGSLKAAVRARLIPRNPASDVGNLPRAEKREQQYLTASEVERLVLAAPDRYKALVQVLAYCGLRSGEAFALRRRSVNMMRRELRITESATPVGGRMAFGPTKTHQARTVGIPVTIARALEEHLNEFVAPDGDSLVFTAPSGTVVNPSNFRRRVWKPALVEAGLPKSLRIHDCRHTSVSLLVDAGVPITSVMQHVGHSSITTTIDRYAHLYPEARSEVTEALDLVILAAQDNQSDSANGQNADSPVLADIASS